MSSQGAGGFTRPLIAVDGMDPLRDEAIVFERILREAGNKTKLHICPGLPHGHWGFFPFSKASDQFRKDQIEAVGWLLDMEPDWSGVQTSAEIAAVSKRI